MLNYKEFYYWLEGYLHGRLEDKGVPITPIVEKMNEVKEVNPFFPDQRIVVPSKFEPVPIPINPFKDDDPYKPPFTVTCETKQQLND
jgi:hypothetical protein